MRATIVAAKDNASEFEQLSAWLERWRSRLLLCSDALGCGCCVQMRNVDAPADSLAELPSVMLSDSEWSRTGAAAAQPISAMPTIPDLPSAVPEIPVSDLASATTYYRDNLTFNIDWIADDIALAGVSRGDCRLFLAGPTFRRHRGKINPVVTWLNMGSSAAVDDIHEAWRASNAVLLSAPQSNSWGLHEFSAADLDGNEFRVFYDFATPERERGKSSTV